MNVTIWWQLFSAFMAAILAFAISVAVLVTTNSFILITVVALATQCGSLWLLLDFGARSVNRSNQ